ncbi:HAD-IB family phosphatase [bacterium]|nr:HAD-IB family phosphatase [bacterium]
MKDTGLKAVGFDVDGTLIINIGYCWETFHDRFGVSQKIRKRLKGRYLDGQITYKQWGSKEIAIWRELGVKRDDFIAVIKSLRLVDGAIETLNVLRQTGLYLFILSGTVSIILEEVFPTHASLFDRVAVSHILFDDAGRPVDFDPGHPLRMERENKAAELESLCQETGFAPEQVAFVGDNDNDVGVLRASGLGIAFCPRSKNAACAADAVVEIPDLKYVLPHILKRVARQ